MKSLAPLALVLGLAATMAAAQSYTTIVLTESATSTTTIVLPAWPTSPTTQPGGPASTAATATTGVTPYPTTTAPSTVPTAGAEAMLSLGRSAMGSMMMFVVLGLVVV